MTKTTMVTLEKDQVFHEICAFDEKRKQLFQISNFEDGIVTIFSIFLVLTKK